MTITIIPNGFPVRKAFFRRMLEPLARRIGLKGTASIRMGSEEESRDLNLRYRQRETPTDVLSFMNNGQTPDGPYAGDILICYPVAVQQARENGHSVEKELLLLMVHGLLHLRGHDHETDRGEMLRLQKEILKNIVAKDE